MGIYHKNSTAPNRLEPVKLWHPQLRYLYCEAEEIIVRKERGKEVRMWKVWKRYDLVTNT